MRRPPVNVGWLTAIILFAASLWVEALGAEPFIPVDDAQVLERLPIQAVADPRILEARRLRVELEQDPERLESALRLAQLYLEIGREDGDPRYQGYAEAALTAWWDQPQPPPGVLMIRATVRQNRHDFDRALQDLERLLRLQPRNARAWLMRSVILQVRGDYSAARASCLPVGRSDRLLAAACLAGVGSLSGEAEASYELLRQALVDSAEAAEGRAWALTGLAEIAARLGREDVAEQHFEQAMSLASRDLYLIAAYADFLLDQGRPDEVRKMLADEKRVDALLLRLALAESRLGSPSSGALVASLKDRFAEGRLRGDRLHQGAEARFRLHLLGQPVESLTLALANWQVQREPVDARRVLEAAVAARDPAAAAPVVEWLEDSGLEDVRIAALLRQVEGLER